MGTLKNYKNGEMIFKEGKLEMLCYEVVSGKVDIISNIGTEKEKKLVTLESGKWFGELGMIDYLPRSASAVAASDCELNVYDEENLKAALKNDPMIMLQILRTITERTNALSKEYEEACRDIEEYYRSEKASTSLMARIMNLINFANANTEYRR